VRKYRAVAAVLIAVNLAAWTAKASKTSARQSEAVDDNLWTCWSSEQCT
jgi:hypothetical protein